MAKRKRSEAPMDQGVLKFIFKWFLAPLVVYKPTDMPLSDWYAQLFDIKCRDIKRYVVVYPFKMPGLLQEAPYRLIQGLGRRAMLPQDVLWVRETTREPNEIDVEVVGSKDEVFRLTSSEWGWIKLRCKEQDGRTAKKEEPAQAKWERREAAKRARRAERARQRRARDKNG